MLITKYKFNNTLYDLFPEFNSGFEFTYTDEVNGEVTTRTIESDSLPTSMRFGSNLTTYVEGSELALLEILDMNTSGLTSCYRMFRYCKNLTSITCEWDTSNVTNMETMFAYCSSLTELNLSGFNTSNVTTMGSMFNNCNKLTSLDVSNFDTSNVTTMWAMFDSCHNLTSLDVSNWNTSKVTTMGRMFSVCEKLTSLDVSNFDTSKVTDMIYMFNKCCSLTSLDVSSFDTSKVTTMEYVFYNTPLLKDIGMLYCNASTIQKIINAMPTDLNKTLWYKEANIDNITYNNNITLKKYIEENIEIVLNNPLLEGDTIEIVDGKLCHVHRYDKVVLDGSEDEVWRNYSGTEDRFNAFVNAYNCKWNSINIVCDRFQSTYYGWAGADCVSIGGSPHIQFFISRTELVSQDITGVRQWLQANPTTVVYELAEPYYEDITPYQSSIALRTFEDCNIQIITVLPIKTKITYRTNITSAVVLEQELDTLDSGVSLSNLIEEEVDE